MTFIHCSPQVTPCVKPLMGIISCNPPDSPSDVIITIISTLQLKETKRREIMFPGSGLSRGMGISGRLRVGPPTEQRCEQGAKGTQRRGPLFLLRVGKRGPEVGHLSQVTLQAPLYQAFAHIMHFSGFR